MEYNDIAEHQTTTEGQFIDDIKELLEAARNNVVRQVNTTMLMTYFEIGRRIVEQEQKGESQADYGQYLLVRLSFWVKSRWLHGTIGDWDGCLSCSEPFACSSWRLAGGQALRHSSVLSSAVWLSGNC